MDVIVPVLIGLVLVSIHALTLFVMMGYIKRIILCTKKIDAMVKSVTEEVHKHEDSQTGKTEYDYSYLVTFKYDYNGQTYESSHNYSDHCRYIKNQNTIIKINPHNPRESWTKGELKDLLIISLIIPVLAFFDYVYIICVFK